MWSGPAVLQGSNPACSASASLTAALPPVDEFTQHFHSSTIKWNSAQSHFGKRNAAFRTVGPVPGTDGVLVPDSHRKAESSHSKVKTRLFLEHKVFPAAAALQVQGLAVSFVSKSNSTPSVPILPSLSTVPVSQFRILTGRVMSQCTTFYSNSR